MNAGTGKGNNIWEATQSLKLKLILYGILILRSGSTLSIAVFLCPLMSTNSTGYYLKFKKCLFLQFFQTLST